MLARRLIANLRAGRGADVTIDAGADLDGLLEGGYRALPPDAQALALALALADGTGDMAAIAGLGDAAAVAARRRTGVRPGGSRLGPTAPLHLPSAAHRRAALAAASPALCARIAEPALALLRRR